MLALPRRNRTRSSAGFPHDPGVICEARRRGSWFVCKAHGRDKTGLAGTQKPVAVDVGPQHRVGA